VRERVRALVEGTSLPIRVVAEQTGVSRTTVSSWMARNNWPRPDGAPRFSGDATRGGGRARLVARLHTTFGRQLATLEKRAKDAGEETLEKDARTLGVLAKTLETLIELDRDGAKVTKPEPVDRDAIDAELARKIENWARGGSAD
jgi:hypothetical protein